MNPFLETRELTFQYRGRAPAVNEINLRVTAGSMAAIIGPNGAGKSTLLRLFAGLLSPSRGEVRLQGCNLATYSLRDRARRIAVMPQHTPATFPFRAEDVVLSGRAPHVPRFQFEGGGDREIALAALAAVGAADLADRLFPSLSGGERQMVVLARALAQQPQLLLLDEPTAGLDPRHASSLFRALAEARRTTGMTVIAVAHDLAWVGTHCDAAFALREGRLAAQGTPAELLNTACLAAIYDEPRLRAEKIGQRIAVWLEA